MKNIINYLYIFVILFASEFIFSDELEEVIVVADYRQTDLSKEDSSVLILDEDDIKIEPIKHFENLWYHRLEKFWENASDGAPCCRV